MKNQFRPDGLKVVVFDVDGTLYRQRPLRRAMLARLLRSYLLRPVRGWRALRTLSAYRHAQESLRGGACGDMAAAQIGFVCDRTGIDRDDVVQCVEQWMERAPLPILRQFRHEGLIEFLHACRARGLRLAVLSDYPASDKLAALEVAGLFDLVLCAQTPEIGAFKPSPRGLEVALERLGVAADECLYVGDRVDVDAAAASAAGIAAVIVSSAPAPKSAGHYTVTGYPQLQDLLFGHRTDAEPQRQPIHRVA